MTSHDRDDVLLAHLQNLRTDVVEARDGIKGLNLHVLDLLQRTARIEERNSAAKDIPARWATALAILTAIWSLVHGAAK